MRDAADTTEQDRTGWVVLGLGCCNLLSIWAGYLLLDHIGAYSWLVPVTVASATTLFAEFQVFPKARGRAALARGGGAGAATPAAAPHLEAGGVGIVFDGDVVEVACGGVHTVRINAGGQWAEFRRDPETGLFVDVSRGEPGQRGEVGA